METLKDFRNELFKRQELTFKLESEKTPSFNDSKKIIADNLKKDENNIDVYNVKGIFGKNKFLIKANIYDSKEDLDSIKKLELTSKQRKEAAKAKEEKPEETTEEKTEVSEPAKEESAEPAETSVEDRPQEEEKEAEEKIKEESKE